MKKVMFALALAAVGSAFAIESSNIVGYSNQDTKIAGGFQGIGTTFRAMEGTGKAGDLKVTGYTGMYYDNGVYCCKLDYAGRSGELMFWADYTEAGDTWLGWYNADWDVCYNDTELQAGEGLWFTAPTTDFKILSSGQVGTGTTEITLLSGGFVLCPNPTPVAVQLKDTFMNGYGTSYSDNGIYCCKLDYAGRSLDLMFWADYSEAGDTWYGWYNADWDVDYGTVEIAPGESLWMTTPDASWKFNWPSAL